MDGDLLDCADDALVHAAGEALAALHLDLADCPFAPTPVSQALLAGRLEGLPAHLPRAAVEALRAQLGQAPEVALPEQVVHGDYRSANILCRGGRVVAVLDFEEARVDHAVAELARAAVLLGTRFRDWGPVTPHTRTVLREGYESVRPLTADEAAWWDPLVLWHSLLCVPEGDDPTGWGAAALAQASPCWGAGT